MSTDPAADIADLATRAAFDVALHLHNSERDAAYSAALSAARHYAELARHLTGPETSSLQW